MLRECLGAKEVGRHVEGRKDDKNILSVAPACRNSELPNYAEKSHSMVSTVLVTCGMYQERRQTFFGHSGDRAHGPTQDADSNGGAGKPFKG